MKCTFVKFTALLSVCFLYNNSVAQFNPPQGVVGSTAMFKDSSAFVAWASICDITRGLQDISVTSSPYANVGDSSSAIGIAGLNGVVSLGDGGTAILQFNAPIVDASGADFAVFENSFDGQFLELAFVEVSSDGVHYFRFPATSNTDTTVQTWSFGLTDATKINNLAGKYRAEYGTPFDLADITDDAMLDKQAITHVKIIDVVGCIQAAYCSRDMNGHIINDPWPTNFGSGGFDLDAVGVIHQKTVGLNELELQHVTMYPNPAKEVLYVSLSEVNYSLSVTNIVGETVFQSQRNMNTTAIKLDEFNQGIYIITITAEGKQKQLRFVKF